MKPQSVPEMELSVENAARLLGPDNQQRMSVFHIITCLWLQCVLVVYKYV